MNYLLLGTEGCHLCELANEVTKHCFADKFDCTVKTIDITEHSQWQADFSTKIPVLLHGSSKAYLCWPFTENDVLTFINQYYD